MPGGAASPIAHCTEEEVGASAAVESKRSMRNERQFPQAQHRRHVFASSVLLARKRGSHNDLKYSTS
jgi:hypothetical protein